MPNILLQITQAYEQSLVSRLGDQLFCIVLLVGFAIYSLRRQKLNEDKLEKYMAEDREQMKSVINNNTKALEIFNSKTLRISLLLAMLFISGCITTKKSKVVKTTDSVQLFASSSVSSHSIRNKETERKDSIFGMPARTVTANFKPEDFKPLFNDKGEAKPHTKRIQGKGVSFDLQVNTDGSVTASANCDSITFVVANLVREKIELKNSYDSLATSNSKQSHTELVATTKTTRSFNWLQFLFGFAVGGVCVWLFNKLNLKTLFLTLLNRS